MKTSGPPNPRTLRVAAEVAAARDAGRPVVGLESSVLAQGLPIPANVAAAQRMEGAVRRAKAVPAITGVVRGEAAVGLTTAELERFLARDGIIKVSARDLGLAAARGFDGATTVAAALVLCERAGVPVFATGGIGGVHREPAFDESADLLELARRPVVVVCSGAKSILDLTATVERLETLGVPVLGYQTSEFPGFFYRETGIALATSVSSAAEVAEIYRAHRALGLTSAIVVAQPPPDAAALSRAETEAAVQSALDDARRGGVRGSATTPFLLAAIEKGTSGRSLETNLALLEANASLAADIAVALAQ